MGILFMPFGPMPKLLLAAAIPLGAFANLCTFLSKAISFMSISDQDHLASLAADEADAILYSSLSSSVEAVLPSVSYESLHHEADLRSHTCAVCINEINCKDEVRRLPHCSHLYHTPCIDTWLRRNHRTCPLCRAPLLVTSEERRHPAYPHESVALRLASLEQEEEGDVYTG
eukprot:c16777_g1_i1 orf=365-880(-)